MIAKGTTHNDGGRLAIYLITGKEGERAELWELRGFASPDIVEAFRSVHVMAEGTQCEQPFMHVQVRLPEGETLTREQWRHVAHRIESKLGLTGQPRAIASHIDEQTGEEHMHVAWSRIDEDTLTAKPVRFYKLRLKEVSRELEKELGLTIVPNERESQIQYAPTRAEDEQARRLGLDPHEVREIIRACYDRSENGASFQAALAHEGFTLAQGDQRGFVVIDHGGGIHALGKRILDVSAAKIRDHLSDLARDHLPTVEQARASHLSREPQARKLKKELAEVQQQIDTERLPELDTVISATLFERAIREPHLTTDVQILAWGMPADSMEELNEAIAAAQEVQARKLQLADIDKLITERNVFAYTSERDAVDEFVRLRRTNAPALAYVRAADSQQANNDQLAERDCIIYAALLDHAIREPHLTTDVQILAWGMPADFMEELNEAIGTVQEVQARKLELVNIDRLITERNALAIRRDLAELDELMNTAAEREYAQRDPVREDMAWHDAVAQAAIEKEQREGRAARNTGGRRDSASPRQDRPQPQPAPELGRAAGEIRLAYRLTDGTGDFLKAMEERDFRAARVTAEDIHERDSTKAQREKDEILRILHSPQDMWMLQTGGASALSPELAARAKAAYDIWLPKAKALRRDPFEFEPYVDYVQKKWAELAKQHGIDIEAAKQLPPPVIEKRPRGLSDHARSGDVVLLDRWGHVYELNQRTTGDSRENAQAFLAGIDRNLPSINAARREQQEQRKLPGQERELNEVQGQIRLAFSLSQSAEGFIRNLDELASQPVEWEEYRPGKFRVAGDRVLSIARVTKEDAVKSQIDSYYAKHLPIPDAEYQGRKTIDGAKYTPVHREGDYVAITERGQMYALDRLTTGKNRDEIQKFMATVDPKQFQSIEASKQMVQARGEQHDIKARAFQNMTSIGLLNKPGWQYPVRRGRGKETAADTLKKMPIRALGKLGKTLDVASDAFQSLFSPILTPEQKLEGEISRLTREAEGQSTIDFSKYTTQRAIEQQQHEQDRDAEQQRQREHERDGGGRER